MNSRTKLLLIRKLLVGRGPGTSSVSQAISSSDGIEQCFLLDGQSLSITNIRKIGNELEPVDYLASRSAASLDSEAQNTAESSRKILLGYLMMLVASKSGIGNPAHVFALFEVLGKCQCILRVSLGSQAQSLDAEQQLLCGKWVHSRSQVSKDLNASADDVGDGAKGIPELEAVIARGRFDKLREPLGVFAPVKLA